MGNVISLTKFKKKIILKIYAPSENEEFLLLREGLISQWQYEESKKTLNSFIAAKLQIEHQDFINDLNAIAELESDSSITIRILSPAYADNLNGWVSSFIVNDIEYSSIELDTEAKSRIFAVLLYHALLEAASKTYNNVI